MCCEELNIKVKKGLVVGVTCSLRILGIVFCTMPLSRLLSLA